MVTENPSSPIPRVYGLMAEFEKPEALLEAAHRAYEQGYRRMDAYSPFPVEGLSEALGMRRTALPLVVLGGGITGALAGYFMQYYATVIDYPINVGGRPLHSWPAYIPITFEMTILFAAFGRSRTTRCLMCPPSSWPRALTFSWPLKPVTRCLTWKKRLNFWKV